ncbi:MAG: DUF1552 domain-containing protein [Polyangiales bacterium]
MNRRMFLRGLGGVAIALPTLEIMLNSHGEAFADGKPIPKRFLVCFDGQSLGGDGDPIHNFYVPDKTGADYDLKQALAPLADNGNVKNEISVVSGLKIPWAGESSGMIPAGGRSDDFHIQSLCPLFTGMRNKAASDSSLQGPTADQVVADAITDASVKFKTLNYQVQAAWYLSVSAPYGRDIMSAKLVGGAIEKVPGLISPQEAWNGLFKDFVPADPKAAAQAAFELRRRKSILDLVDKNTSKLLPRLGKVDQARLQRHLDEIRDLERRISTISPMTTDVCKKPTDPGPDPALGGDNGSAGGDGMFDVNKGYSDEDTRARLFCDLILMAFACDLARSGTLMFTMAQSHMNTYKLTGFPWDQHELGHSAPEKTKAVSSQIAWHMKHFGYLVSKLRDTPEGAGKLIDNSAVVMLHEGGHGWDPQGVKDNSSHSTERMACLIAGRAGGLKPGQHVVATGKHPVNVLNSGMKAVGVAKDLGEVTGVIPELFA